MADLKSCDKVARRHFTSEDLIGSLLANRRYSPATWLGLWQTYVGIALLPGTFFLLVGQKALQEFGTFLFIALYAKPQEYFTGLRNTPCLQLRHLLELLL